MSQVGGRPLVSIVIPTRNRAVYAMDAINSALDNTSDRVEVVVQDNSDDHSLEDLLETWSMRVARVSYEHCSDLMSFAENFQRAFARVSGKFVCFIGDDDAVLPTLERTAEWCDQFGYLAALPSLDVTYFWPGAVGDRVDAGELRIRQSDLSAERFTPTNGVERLLRGGGVDYLSLPLVKVYHGLANTDSLRSILAGPGDLFGGLSPDIYSAVRASLAITEAVKVGWPVTLSGICGRSGSADAASGRHTGRLSDAPHFRGNPDYNWDPRVPAVYSVETIWADSTLHALEGLSNFSVLFNPDVLVRILRWKHKNLRDALPTVSGPSGSSAFARYVLSLSRRSLAYRVASAKGRAFSIEGPISASASASLWWNDDFPRGFSKEEFGVRIANAL